MRRDVRPLAVLPLVLSAHVVAAQAPRCPYAWTAGCATGQALEERVVAPPGYVREAVEAGSFAEWLRRLPLLPGWPPVRLHDGRLKGNQEAHAAVVDMDVGRGDLQQCADAVIRLWAEYLFAAGRRAAIDFRFTSGAACPFERWARGERPMINGDRVRWRRSAAADASHASLRRYLDVVFTYAGSASLERQLEELPASAPVRAGDVFIRGGFPGHAVLVVDTARHQRTGARVFLLVQSYMPAQQVHVLRNLTDASLDPWYSAELGPELLTPEWIFERQERRRFSD